MASVVDQTAFKTFTLFFVDRVHIKIDRMEEGRRDKAKIDIMKSGSFQNRHVEICLIVVVNDFICFIVNDFNECLLSFYDSNQAFKMAF